MSDKNINIIMSVPVMTLKKFAQETGLAELSRTENETGIVRGMVERKQLPIAKIGRHNMIDLIALSEQITNGRG